MSRVLITCPPMLRRLEHYTDELAELEWEVTAPEVVQTLSVAELLGLVPEHDGWIIGDDPACAEVVAAGSKGRLKGAVKWGAGVDNVDFDAFSREGVPVVNTPGMFGNEVADVALGYVIGLSRFTFEIHNEVLTGGWPKPAGVSLAGKTVGVVGFGYIGQQLAKRLRACEMMPLIYDPLVAPDEVEAAGYEHALWPAGLDRLDFLVFCCALTESNYHMLDAQALEHCKAELSVVNVARGGLIDEAALAAAAARGRLGPCALDVFETEPLPADSPLRQLKGFVFGTHNSSNTVEAVDRTSRVAIARLREMLCP